MPTLPESPSVPPSAIASENRYAVCLSDRENPIYWSLDTAQRHVPTYVHRVFRQMERHLDRGGWTVYLTWRLDRLPSVGPNVIAVVMGDEWSRVPAYANQVAATFKCYGTSLPLGSKSPWRPSYLNMLLWTKYLRTQVRRLPSLLRHAATTLSWRIKKNQDRPPIYDFPLGYGNQMDLPLRPLPERPYDLFFAGSVEHAQYPFWSPKYWIQSPKAVSRHRMIEEMGKLARRDPSIEIKLSTTSEFAWNAVFYNKPNTEGLLDARTYSEHMMNAKICLVPRGTSLETFRFFEALRYGCILITEPLPDRWFYDGAPVIEIEDWSTLITTIKDLLASPKQLQLLHEASLNWWNRVCSEEAVGRFMANKINALPSSSTASPSALS